ncbi:condensation domain-containing protein [Streptomyces sp. NPDC059169]|uniref:condensation domain-containing protein n=1 Tax=unclassified Streptomyces TaxID=2593676 RepID=UPI0036901C8C
MARRATRPFDFERDWLVRARILLRGDAQVLVLSLHHLVCDVSSLSVLLAGLTQEYARGAYSRDTPAPAAPYSALPVELESAALTRADAL